MMKNCKVVTGGATIDRVMRSDSSPGTPTGQGEIMATTLHDHGTAPARRATALALAPALLLVGLVLSPIADAGLGEAVDSVQRDHAALRGTTLAVTPTQAYDLHEITTAEGTRVREYVSRAGTVFAVTWSGPSLPSLKVVLGPHYDEYAAAAAAPEHTRNHKVFTMATTGLVLHIRKLPRGFTGSAHVPALIPPGATAQDIR
jgi:hypothetical protein